MLLYYTMALLMLYTAAYGFPRGKATEKPEIPLMANPVPPKNRKPLTHISEFTDPDTGLNPFLDLEEGPTSVGRNVMEDERRHDAPLDFDLVEGDAPNRRGYIDEPKEAVNSVYAKWPTMDYKDEIETSWVTTPSILPNSPTTVKHPIIKSTEKVKIEVEKSDKDVQKKEKEDNDSFAISKSTVIYVSATIAALAALVLLIGACWWKRKLKTQQSTAVRENETKS